MNKFIKFILFVLGVTYQPLSLFLVWLWNIRPYNWLVSKFNIPDPFQNLSNAVTIKSALDVALLAWLLNLFFQLIKWLSDKIERPIKIDAKIVDPKDESDNKVTLYDYKANVPLLLKITIVLDIRSTFMRKLVEDICKPTFFVVWPAKWLSIKIDDTKGYSDDLVRRNNNTLEFSLWEYIAEEEKKSKFNFDIFFSVNNRGKREGSINFIIKSQNKIFGIKHLLNLLIIMLVERRFEGRIISLKKET